MEILIIVSSVIILSVISLFLSEHYAMKCRSEPIKVSLKKLKCYYLCTPLYKKESWHFRTSVCYFEKGYEPIFFYVPIIDYIPYLLFIKKEKQEKKKKDMEKQKMEFEKYIYGE